MLADTYCSNMLLRISSQQLRIK